MSCDLINGCKTVQVKTEKSTCDEIFWAVEELFSNQLLYAIPQRISSFIQPSVFNVIKLLMFIHEK